MNFKMIHSICVLYAFKEYNDAEVYRERSRSSKAFKKVLNIKLLRNSIRVYLK